MKIDTELQKRRAEEMLISLGVDSVAAATVADCLSTADAYGVTSHGLETLPAHIERIKRGGYNLTPRFRTVRETAAFAVIDGDGAIGPVAADYCMRYAMDRAREVGVFTVFSRNNNTFGPAFYYSLRAAERGFVAFICSNSPAQMPPSGGVSKMLGTNPFSAVIPTADGEPIIIDMATSAVAKSKFKQYKARDEHLPEGLALDAEGNPTTDPDEAMRGLVLPMAGFKGYAISMLIDIFSGVMSGAGYLDRVGRFYSEDGASMNVGFYITVIEPSLVFGDGFLEEMKEYKDRIRNSAPHGDSQIALPGDDRIRTFKGNNKID